MYMGMFSYGCRKALLPLSHSNSSGIVLRLECSVSVIFAVLYILHFENEKKIDFFFEWFCWYLVCFLFVSFLSHSPVSFLFCVILLVKLVGAS